MDIKKMVKEFDLDNPKWELLPKGFLEKEPGSLGMELNRKWHLMKMKHFLTAPVNSRDNSPKSPFYIKEIEKTKRQSTRNQGYKASALWQTSMLLHDIATLWYNSLNLPYSPLNSRTEGQFLDALRSIIANIEEGYARPTTKEYLDYLGFSQGSLTEVRGDVERFLSKGILKSVKNSCMKSAGIPTPSRDFPYPSVKSRNNPGQYGTLNGKLREFCKREIKGYEITFEVLLELINKTENLNKKTVEGLHKKVIRDKTKEINEDIYAIQRR